MPPSGYAVTRAVAVVVAHQGRAVLADDVDVVLGLGRAGVVADRELRQRRVARAHDRRPDAGAVGVAVVGRGCPRRRDAGRGCDRPRGGDLGDGGRRVARRRKVEGRLVVLRVPRHHAVEGADVGHSGAAAATRGDRGAQQQVGGDRDAGAVGEVVGRGTGEARGPRVLGRHVDAEGRVVLRDAGPHLLHHVELGGRERRVAVAAVRRHGERRGARGVPGGVVQVVPVEVQVDDSRRRRAGVQQEGLVVGQARGRPSARVGAAGATSA